MIRENRPVWHSTMRKDEEVVIDGPCVVRLVRSGINGGKVQIEIERERSIRVRKRLTIPKRKR